MLNKLVSVKGGAWAIVALAALYGGAVIMLPAAKIVPGQQMMYTYAPLGALMLAGAAYWLGRGQKDRVRNPQEKAITIGSVMAIWFVLYFASGIFVTFVRNALASSFQAFALNLVGFAVTAAALEYARHRAVLLAGRRNALWFGAIIAVVFTLGQLGSVHLADANNLSELIKLSVSDIIPALVNSILLTYLAVACGFPGQLTYRLALVAMTIIPPVLPKYDWYLVGVTSVLIAIIIYLVIDHTQQERHAPSRRHRTHRAFDAMWVITMVGLILFMTGFFAYKPSAIMSDSMHPTFSRGSMVIVQKTENKMDISIGDIIQYEAHDVMVTHRVIRVDNASDGSGKRVFTTKGDNNPSADQPVNEDQVTGIVRSQVPYIGYPTVWLREITVGNDSKKING